MPDHIRSMMRSQPPHVTNGDVQEASDVNAEPTTATSSPTLSQPSHVMNDDMTGASNINTKKLDARQTARAAEINIQANKKVDKITVSKKLLTNMDEQIAYLLKKRATVFEELDLTEKQLAMDQELLINVTKPRPAR